MWRIPVKAVIKERVRLQGVLHPAEGRGRLFFHFRPSLAGRFLREIGEREILRPEFLLGDAKDWRKMRCEVRVLRVFEEARYVTGVDYNTYLPGGVLLRVISACTWGTDDEYRGRRVIQKGSFAEFLAEHREGCFGELFEPAFDTKLMNVEVQMSRRK